MSSGERLPQQDSDGPDVCRTGRIGPCEPLRRDVGERSGDVPNSSEGVGVLELRQPEVEEADGDLVAVLEHDVGRLDVAVDDALRVGVVECFEHLGGGFDGAPVVDRSGAERVAKSAALDVRVGDVDVTVVAGQRERAQAARMAQAGGGVDLALGARAGLPFALDDLQCDVTVGVFVACQPDRSTAAASEGSERPVPAEDEVVLGERDSRLHRW